MCSRVFVRGRVRDRLARLFPRLGESGLAEGTPATEAAPTRPVQETLP